MSWIVDKVGKGKKKKKKKVFFVCSRTRGLLQQFSGLVLPIMSSVSTGYQKFHIIYQFFNSNKKYMANKSNIFIIYIHIFSFNFSYHCKRGKLQRLITLLLLFTKLYVLKIGHLLVTTLFGHVTHPDNEHCLQSNSRFN